MVLILFLPSNATLAEPLRVVYGLAQRPHCMDRSVDLSMTGPTTEYGCPQSGDGLHFISEIPACQS